jgi:putative SOS response-associated peptidase YedK
MCGRFTLTAGPLDLSSMFPLFSGIQWDPRYNIAPTQMVLAVRTKPESKDLEAVRLRWGLVPSWADSPKIGYRLINARSETVSQKPAFRTAFRRRRCVILADGYYEWQKLGEEKQPYYIHQPDSKPFAMAGLWERWDHPESESPAIESCTIITTDANESLRAIHDRMPVILPKEELSVWLDGAVQEPALLTGLLRPAPNDRMTAYAVSTVVNSPKNDGPACIAPAA